MLKYIEATSSTNELASSDCNWNISKKIEREREREAVSKIAKEKEEERKREEADPGNIDPVYGVFLSLTEEAASITTFRNYLRVCSRGGDSSYRVSRVWLLVLGSAVDQVGTWVVDTSGRICRYRHPLKRCPRDTMTRSDDGDLQNRERCEIVNLSIRPSWIFYLQYWLLYAIVNISNVLEFYLILH